MDDGAAELRSSYGPNHTGSTTNASTVDQPRPTESSRPGSQGSGSAQPSQFQVDQHNQSNRNTMEVDGVKPVGQSKALGALFNFLNPKYSCGNAASAERLNDDQQQRRLFRFPEILHDTFPGSPQGNGSIRSTISTSIGDPLHPAESLGLSGNPPRHPSQSGWRGSGSTQDPPRSPSNAPPNPPHPHNSQNGPASAGPSSSDRRQRSQPQDKLLMDLGESVSRMNSNLEVLNSNLGALNDIVKGSYVSRNKGKGKATEAQPSEDDNADTDMDDEDPAVREYNPPKRKSARQNNLHVCPFLVRKTLVMLTVLQKLVRAHTCTLLKKKAKEPLICNVTQEEVDGFNSSTGYPCTKERFHLYLIGTTVHKWNRAAAEVFTEIFLEGRAGFKHDQVKKYFITHVRTLISRFKKEQQLRGLTAKEQENATDVVTTQTRRSTRKHNVS